MRKAEFDPRVKSYWIWQKVLIFAVTIILLPISLLCLIFGKMVVEHYLARMSCVLTERSLEIKKGLFNRVESTVPLEKITDLQMFQGPMMRHFGVHGFKVETAGQTAVAGGALVQMVGIVDTPGFRKAVLAQRDLVARGGPAIADAAKRSTGKAGETSDTTVEVLREIRDTLARVEHHLRDR